MNGGKERCCLVLGGSDSIGYLAVLFVLRVRAIRISRACRHQAIIDRTDGVGKGFAGRGGL